MATPTSAAIIAASQDPDLIQRAIALGATLDPPLTQADVESARTRLAAAPVDETGKNSLASLFEYALAAYKPTPRPGEDPSKVTDTHILHALRTLTA